MRAAGESAAEVGLETTMGSCASGAEVAGTYVMPSFGRYEQAAELVRRLRAEVAPGAGSRPAAPAANVSEADAPAAHPSPPANAPASPRRSARLQRMGATDTMELFFEQLNGGRARARSR